MATVSSGPQPAMRFPLGGAYDIPRIGYGAMRLTGQPGNFGPYPDEPAAIALLRRAYELGVRHFDTARSYGPGHNEELIARALYPYADDIMIATKVGVEKTGPGRSVPDGRPDSLRRAVHECLTRLRRDTLDLVYLHCPDPKVTFADSVGALAELHDEGLIRLIGVSNVSATEVTVARATTAIAAVQNRYNVEDRGDDVLLDDLASAGIAYVPYGPLGGDPMRQGASIGAAGELNAADERVGGSSVALGLRWLMRRSPNILLIPGTTTIEHLEQNITMRTPMRWSR